MSTTTDRIYNNGLFVHYEPIKDKKEIYSFIKEDKCFSNHSNLNRSLNILVNYEEMNTRSKNYCIFLRIMYPKDLSKSQRHDFVKKFMFEVSPHYKKILFIYKFIQIGNGRYVDILVFERELYKTEREENVLYKRDMYINKKTGRTTNKSDPEAVQICKKGENKLDENGEPIKVKTYIKSKKKTRYFIFCSNKDKEKKKYNFNKFRLRLCFFVSAALSKISAYTEYFTLKYAKRSYAFSDIRTINTQYYNDAISQINRELRQLQQACIFCHGDQKHLQKIIHSLAKMNDFKNYKLHKHSDYRINISPTAKINENTDNYKEVVNTFKSICLDKIMNWYLEEFQFEIRIIQGDKYNLLSSNSKSSKNINNPISWIITNLRMLINSYEFKASLIEDINNVIGKIRKLKRESVEIKIDYREMVNKVQKIISADKEEKIQLTSQLIIYLNTIF